MSRAAFVDQLPIVPPARRRPLAVVAVVAALVVLAVGATFAGDNTAGPLDDRLIPWLVSTARTERRLALIVDFTGEPVGLASLVVALTLLGLALRRWRLAALVLLGTGLAITVTTVVKPFVHRTIHGDFLSYPSGHTASLTALAMITVLLFWRRLHTGPALVLLYGIALVVGAFAAWAQAGLTAHYPTDTLGGWCTALASVPAAAWLIDRVADRLLLRRSGGTPA